MSCRIFIALKPLAYLNMNHEKMSTVAVPVAVILFTIEFICFILVEGTICNRNILGDIEQIFEIPIDQSKFKIIRFPVGPVHVPILIITALTWHSC